MKQYITIISNIFHIYAVYQFSQRLFYLVSQYCDKCSQQYSPVFLHYPALSDHMGTPDPCNCFHLYHQHGSRYSLYHDLDLVRVYPVLHQRIRCLTSHADHCTHEPALSSVQKRCHSAAKHILCFYRHFHSLGQYPSGTLHCPHTFMAFPGGCHCPSADQCQCLFPL